MNKKILKIIDFFENNIFLLCFLSNLSITKIGGRGFLIQELLIGIVIFLNLFFIKNIKDYLFFIFSNLFIILINITNLQDRDFVKSFLLIILYWGFLYFCFKFKNIEKKLKSFVIGTNILAGYGILQFLILLIGSNEIETFIRNPFGNYTLSTNLHISYMNELPRINSLLYEPSILGVILLLGISVTIFLSEKSLYKNTKKTLTIQIIAILMSGSAIAYIGLGIIVFTVLFIKKSNLYLKFFACIGGGGIIILLMGKVIFRFQEIFIIGTSGYFRIISPIKLIGDILKENYIFGIGVGQLEKYIINKNPLYMYKMGNSFELGLTVDNSIFMMIITFGILSLPIFLYFFMLIIKKVNKSNISVIIAFFFICISTGGYNFIYFNIALGVMILIFRKKE